MQIQPYHGNIELEIIPRCSNEDPQIKILYERDTKE